MKLGYRFVSGMIVVFAAVSCASAVPISDTPLFMSGAGDGNDCTDGAAENATVVSSVIGHGKTVGTLVFQARFDAGDWSGELSAYPYADFGEESVARWHASEGIPAPDERTIYTVDQAGRGVAFRWERLDADAQAALNDDESLLAFLRGEDGEFRPRPGPLGDIIHSTPAFAGDTDYGYGLLAGAEGDGYRRFVAGKAERDDIVLVGANDGMLHVFNAGDGGELFAYVPRSLLPALPELADRDYEHRYYVDGSPSVADAYLDGQWRTLAVTTLGRGGAGVFALDATEPESWGAESVLWEVAPGNAAMERDGVDPGAYLGVAMGRPAIVRAESGDWVAVIGNGYNSARGTAALIVVDLATGDVLRVLDTGAGDDNGLAVPAAVDRDRDGSVDTVYAGDLKGNLWKFDLSGERPADWHIAYSRNPLFKATASDGTPQPITARPDAVASPHGGLMVVFGTGKYLGGPDVRDTATQSVYGIWDVEGAAGAAAPGDVPVGGLAELRRRRVLDNAGVGDTGSRLLSREPVDYTGDDAVRGWVFDLSYAGERIVRDVTVFDGKAILVSTIPDDDPCAFGGRSALIELDPVIGTQFDEPVLDLNGDGRFDGEDGIADDAADGAYLYPGMIDLGAGLAAAPEILIREDGDHEKRFSGANLNGRKLQEKGLFKPGRASWQQMR